MIIDEKIVYMSVSKGGGVDGMDHSDIGGKLINAYWSRVEAEKNPNNPWRNIVPEVVDVEKAKRSALKKLDALDKLVLGL